VCKECDKQFGDELAPALETSYDIVKKRLTGDVLGVSRGVEGAATIAVLTSARMFAKHWDWLSFVPTSWIRNSWFEKAMMVIDYHKLRNKYIRYTGLLWGSFLAATGVTYYKSRSTELTFVSSICGASFGLVLQKYMFEGVQLTYRRELRDRNVVSPIVKEWRDNNASRICKAAGIVGALYALAKLYQRLKRCNPQGSLEPRTQEEIDARDREANPYTQVCVRELPVSLESKCTTIDRLENIVSKNLVYGSVATKDKVLRVNCLFLKSNVVVIPTHYFVQDVLDVTFRKENPESCGGKFAVRLCKSASIQIPDTDLSICYSANGGSFKDILKYLPQENLGRSEFRMVYREKVGTLKYWKGLTEPCTVSTDPPGKPDRLFFLGGRYLKLSDVTFDGLCGAVVMSNGPGCAITGFHLGGRNGQAVGCYGVLKRQWAEEAIHKLSQIEGILLSGTAEVFEKQVLGVNIIEGTELHAKSPLNYMPHNSQVEYYGRCKGQSTSHSCVKVTKISESITDVCGVPNIYCAPKMKPEWYGWQLCLANLSVPALPYQHDLLEICVKDYKSAMIPLFRDPLWNDATPLTDHENLCGIPGRKFMDAIKLDTSIGFPLKGKKRPFVNELEPTLERPNNREFKPEIMDEINRCEDCYKRGERAYVIAKACKKDEVLAKPKCRIFYGNAIALTWLVRKYFLPILRVMQMNPLVSECAVGINSHGPEWERLHNYVFEHGEDRLIGGDYGKYDQKIPSQLLLASLRIMIDFARECNYSEADISVMKAMSGDLVYALIAFNGDLIGLTEGTHISGNSLTVILNGICGSLNLRAYFYTVNKPLSFESRIPFRDVVNLMTYGDDNIGSVSKKINNFTIKGISEFLAEYGQIYTMPDKESELLDFLPPEEFEFLKRKSVYCPKKGMHVGALVEKSIFKMLHMYMREKGKAISEQQACAENIDTALREWFNHGEEIYESRRQEMSAVAKIADIHHLTTMTEVSYDEKIKDWKYRYLGDGDDVDESRFSFDIMDAEEY
jgi:hypothetical protein